MDTSLIHRQTTWIVSLLVLALLVGGNTFRPGQAAFAASKGPTSTPRPNITPAPTVTPLPASTCPVNGRSGVYLYADANYGGACSYFAFAAEGSSGSPDPTTWAVGDNSASSMRVIMPSSSDPSSSQSVTVTLYDGVTYTSLLSSWTTSQLITIPDFGMSKIPLNNRASSIQLNHQVSLCGTKCP